MSIVDELERPQDENHDYLLGVFVDFKSKWRRCFAISHC